MSSSSFIRASIGVSVLISSLFKSSSTSEFFSMYSTSFSGDSIQIWSCNTFACFPLVVSWVWSIRRASSITFGLIQARRATSSQKLFLIPQGIIFRKKTRFSSFSPTATEKFFTPTSFSEVSISSW